jgi:hypothetical protein
LRFPADGNGGSQVYQSVQGVFDRESKCGSTSRRFVRELSASTTIHGRGLGGNWIERERRRGSQKLSGE